MSGDHYHFSVITDNIMLNRQSKYMSVFTLHSPKGYHISVTLFILTGLPSPAALLGLYINGALGNCDPAQYQCLKNAGLFGPAG